jgi:hypothetical protein
MEEIKVVSNLNLHPRIEECLSYSPDELVIRFHTPDSYPTPFETGDRVIYSFLSDCELEVVKIEEKVYTLRRIPGSGPIGEKYTKPGTEYTTVRISKSITQ